MPVHMAQEHVVHDSFGLIHELVMHQPCSPQTCWSVIVPDRCSTIPPSTFLMRAQFLQFFLNGFFTVVYSFYQSSERAGDFGAGYSGGLASDQSMPYAALSPWFGFKVNHVNADLLNNSSQTAMRTGCTPSARAVLDDALGTVLGWCCIPPQRSTKRASKGQRLCYEIKQSHPLG